MDVKSLVILVVHLFAASFAETDKQLLSIPDQAFVPGVFISTDILKLLQENPKDDKQNKGPAIDRNSDQISTTLNTEQPPVPLQYPPTRYVPEQTNQNERLNNQQPAIDQPRQNTNLQGNLNPQPDYNQQQNLPTQLSGSLNLQQYPIQQQGQQLLISQPLQQPNAYNLQPNGQQPNSPVPNGYYQQPNVYNPQLNGYYTVPTYVYSQQPNGYQQPTSYNQYPNVYNQLPSGYGQQPYVYNQQPNIYNQQIVDPNQAFLIHNGQQMHNNPKLNTQAALIVSNPGLGMNASPNQGSLYAIVPVNNQNNLHNPNMGNFIPMQQVPPNTALLTSSKVEED